MAPEKEKTDPPAASDAPAIPAPAAAKGKAPRETGGPKGPDPTRYRDWERGGRCIDF